MPGMWTQSRSNRWIQSERSAVTTACEIVPASIQQRDYYLLAHGPSPPAPVAVSPAVCIDRRLAHTRGHGCLSGSKDEISSVAGSAWASPPAVTRVSRDRLTSMGAPINDRSYETPSGGSSSQWRSAVGWDSRRVNRWPSAPTPRMRSSSSRPLGTLTPTKCYAHASGVDPVAFLTASGLRIHPPDEAIARRVAKLENLLGGRIRRHHRAGARRPLLHDRWRARPPAPATAARDHPLLTELEGSRERGRLRPEPKCASRSTHKLVP
jgi:hypothetical protein